MEYQDLGIVVTVREDDIDRDNTIRFVIPRGLVVIHEGNGHTRYVNRTTNNLNVFYRRIEIDIKRSCLSRNSHSAESGLEMALM